MTDFAQAFQNDHNNISDAVERDPLLVKLSHLVSQSRGLLPETRPETRNYFGTRGFGSGFGLMFNG